MIRPAIFTSLLYVATHLDDADRAELALTRDPDDAIGLADDAWHSRFKYVAFDGGGEPLLAFGAKQQGDIVTVWGFKTARGRAAMRDVTKFIRETMVPTLHAAKIYRAFCIVDPGNRASQAWLRRLGFAPRATTRDIGTRKQQVVIFERDDKEAQNVMAV
jgi:hypothetical protein